MKILFFGKKDDASHAAFTEISLHHEIAGIVECSNTPSHKWKACVFQIFGKFSLQGHSLTHGIPYFNYSLEKKSPELASFIKTIAPDVGCICVFQRLIPESVFKIPKYGIINIHPSLLPQYRGPLPEFWQYWRQDSNGGVTVHLIDAGEDSGSVIVQIPIQIEQGRSIHDYTRECVVRGAREVCRILAGPQPFKSTAQVGECQFRARKLTGDDVLIDWSWPIERIYHVLTAVLSVTELFCEPKFPWSLFSWSPAGFVKKTQQSEILGEFKLTTKPLDVLDFRGGKATLRLRDGDIVFTRKFRIGKLIKFILTR